MSGSQTRETTLVAQGAPEAGKPYLGDQAVVEALVRDFVYGIVEQAVAAAKGEVPAAAAAGHARGALEQQEAEAASAALSLLVGHLSAPSAADDDADADTVAGDGDGEGGVAGKGLGSAGEASPAALVLAPAPPAFRARAPSGGGAWQRQSLRACACCAEIIATKMTTLMEMTTMTIKRRTWGANAMLRLLSWISKR